MKERITVTGKSSNSWGAKCNSGMNTDDEAVDGEEKSVVADNLLIDFK